MAHKHYWCLFEAYEVHECMDLLHTLNYSTVRWESQWSWHRHNQFRSKLYNQFPWNSFQRGPTKRIKIQDQVVTEMNRKWRERTNVPLRYCLVQSNSFWLYPNAGECSNGFLDKGEAGRLGGAKWPVSWFSCNNGMPISELISGLLIAQSRHEIFPTKFFALRLQRLVLGPGLTFTAFVHGVAEGG